MRIEIYILSVYMGDEDAYDSLRDWYNAQEDIQDARTTLPSFYDVTRLTLGKDQVEGTVRVEYEDGGCLSPPRTMTMKAATPPPVTPETEGVTWTQ